MLGEDLEHMPCQTTGLFFCATFSLVLQLLTPLDSIQEVPWIPPGNPVPPPWREHSQGTVWTNLVRVSFVFLSEILPCLLMYISWNSGFKYFGSLFCVHPGQKEIWFLSVRLGHKQESNSILNSSSQWNYLVNETLALCAFNSAYLLHYCVWQEANSGEQCS